MSKLKYYGGSRYTIRMEFGVALRPISERTEGDVTLKYLNHPFSSDRRFQPLRFRLYGFKCLGLSVYGFLL